MEPAKSIVFAQAAITLSLSSRAFKGCISDTSTYGMQDETIWGPSLEQRSPVQQPSHCKAEAKCCFYVAERLVYCVPANVGNQLHMCDYTDNTSAIAAPLAAVPPAAVLNNLPLHLQL